MKYLSTSDQLAYLSLLLDSTLEGFYAVDIKGHITLCNAAFLEMLGYDSRDEVIGKNLHGEIHHTHPDGSPYKVTDCPIYQAASIGKRAFVPYELFFRKDGSSFPVEYRAEPVLDNGEPRGAICTFRDISDRLQKDAENNRQAHERRQAEAQLHVARGRYERLFNNINQGFCLIEMIFDESGNAYDYKYLETNKAFDRQSGVSDTVGKTMLEIAPHHEKVWFERYGEVAKTNQPANFIEFSHTLDRWFEIHAFRFEEQNPNIIAVLFSDITSRKQSDTALLESKAHLSLMVESAQDYAIISTDPHGIITSWNTGAELIFGGRSKDMLGQSIEVIFTPEDNIAGAAQHEMDVAMRIGRAVDERWHIRTNGERFYASGILAGMHDAHGNLTGYIKIARDMTAQQRAQETLLAARNAAESANIAKTEFLANMSHEIRTPMNAIIGLANILSMSQPLTQKQREFISTLQISADSLLRLINDLLDIAKIEARTVDLEHIPFSLTQLLHEVTNMMAVRVKEKGLVFTSEGECVKNRIFVGDPTRLRQIILNLCSNAVKFTDQGGVHVSIIADPLPSPDTKNIYIYVRDTGIGIPADKLETIFQKFVQADSSINRKYGGTGLGLAITKTLVDIMGGTINVESTYGEGSTFTVCLPLKLANDQMVRESNGSLEKVIENSVEHKIKHRILLVEDYAPNVLVATTFLEDFGYMVDVANNGFEAVEMTKDSEYVVALMDVQMHGMNGLEATQLIRAREKLQHLPRLYIIGMTAHALAGDRERCLDAGMDDYIAKPFNPVELELLLSRVIAGEAA